MIKNYTTTIAPSKSIGEIHHILAEHGAVSISTDYENRQPCGLTFIVPTSAGMRGFLLPARVNAIKTILEKQFGKLSVRATDEQAAKVAWRILRDWVDAQMAILEAGMASMTEIMFAYMLDDDGQQTVFQAFERNEQTKLLEAKR